MAHTTVSVEELLKPRYKVNKLGYPGMAVFNPDEVIVLNKKDENGVSFYRYGTGHNTTRWYKEYFDKFPHLFKPLEWWQERKESDMPGYVKLDRKHKDDYCILPHEVFKVNKWSNGFFYSDDINADAIDNREMDFIPATESEYINQNK